MAIGSSFLLGAPSALLIVSVWTFGASKAGVAAVFGLAALFVGILTGFLFGIPRAGTMAPSGAEGAKPAEGSTEVARYRPNTNLEEVSDWITKIIVGLGLANIGKIGPGLTSIGNQCKVAFGKDAPDGTAIIALLIAFAVMGFLGGYILTRTLLSIEFRRVDQAITQADKTLDQDLQTIKQGVSQAIVDSASKVLVTLESDPASNDLVGDADEPNPPPSDPSEIPADLNELADQYLAVNDRNWARRTERKAAIARSMAQLVISNGTLRTALAKSNNEALWLALAGAVVVDPQEGDAETLLSVARKAVRLHVQYGIVLAFLELHQRGLLTPLQQNQARSILDQYSANADESLKFLITRAKERIAS